MIPTPKERFLSDGALAKRHADMVATSEFAVALDAALLEFAAKCARTAVPGEGGLMLKGAHEFARVFCELSMPATMISTRDRDNL